MLRVMVKQARPGMVLARAIQNPRQPDSILLARGYTLTASVIARLHEVGIYDLWVHYAGLDFLDDLFSAELSTQQQRLCETLKNSFHVQAQRTEARLPINQYREVVTDLVQALLTNSQHMAFMSDLGAVDDVLLKHSAEVCYLGVMLGLRLESYLIDQRKRLDGSRAKDVVNLGIGCMLHDIGETQLPEACRESRRPAPDAPGEEWKKHTEMGYALVRPQVEPAAAVVVLNHHQHFDGSGFPKLAILNGPQSGAQIHVYARIAFAADCFQHLLREGGLPMPAVYALWKMQQPPYVNWFDPVILKNLLALAPPFLPGMVVRLSDGRDAVVTHHYEDAPCYPEVQILGGFDNGGADAGPRETISLPTAPESLFIQAVDGFDVTRCLYGPRQTAEGARKVRGVPAMVR